MRRFWVQTIIPLLNVYTSSALIAFFIAFLLLLTHFLSGSEFVGFVVAIAMFTLVLKLLPSIQEFSIAGNTVRLRETLNEATQLTSELRRLRLEINRTLLSLIMRYPGGFGSSFGDNRAKDFLEFYKNIKKSDDVTHMKGELLQFANSIKDSIDQKLLKQNDISENEDYDILEAELIDKNPNFEDQIKITIQQVKELKDIIAELESE